MANKIVRETIRAKGIDIGIYTNDFENEYISLTDIAKYRNDVPAQQSHVLRKHRKNVKLIPK